jgi:hypothetical protein
MIGNTCDLNATTIGFGPPQNIPVKLGLDREIASFPMAPGWTLMDLE